MNTLYLIPNTLADTAIDVALPAHVVQVVRQLKFFIVEGEKSARKFLKLCGVMPPFEGITLLTLDKHTSNEEKLQILKQLNGADAGILSEAGCPAIADPGADLVRLAHEKKMEVRPLVGPSSILLALMGSGFNGQGFTFHGYLPVKPHDRIAKLKELEAQSEEKNFTQTFIETPFRNESLLADIIKNCQPSTYLSVAVDLTSPEEKIITLPLNQWKPDLLPLRNRPTVFSLWRRPTFDPKKAKYKKNKW